MTEDLKHLEYDWYGGAIPANIQIGEDVYIDSSYAFAMFLSAKKPGLIMGKASGAYNRSTFAIGPHGRIDIGAYTCLNNTYLVCNDRVTIGAHCLFSWGVVVTDIPSGINCPVVNRRQALRAASQNSNRWLPPPDESMPVLIEDNVWIGFGSVILPGVTLGEGSIVGCKTIISEDVPPYSVIVGDPARVIRRLNPVTDRC